MRPKTTDQNNRAVSEGRQSIDVDARGSIGDYLKEHHQKKLDKIKLTTFDSFYKMPREDHRYKIHETLIIKEEKKNFSYINQVMTRAKSSIDPRKYSRVVDWRVRSSQQLAGKMDRSKRITLFHEIAQEKKKIPAPSFYKNTWLKPKTHGFYNNSSPRIGCF